MLAKFKPSTTDLKLPNIIRKHEMYDLIPIGVPKRGKSHSRVTTSDKKDYQGIVLNKDKENEKVIPDNTSDEENKAIEELEKKADKILKTAIENKDETPKK